jgi:hypothetical protein
MSTRTPSDASRAPSTRARRPSARQREADHSARLQAAQRRARSRSRSHSAAYPYTAPQNNRRVQQRVDNRRTTTSRQIDAAVTACNEFSHQHPTAAALTAFDSYCLMLQCIYNAPQQKGWEHFGLNAHAAEGLRGSKKCPRQTKLGFSQSLLLFTIYKFPSVKLVWPDHTVILSHIITQTPRKCGVHPPLLSNSTLTTSMSTRVPSIPHSTRLARSRRPSLRQREADESSRVQASRRQARSCSRSHSTAYPRTSPQSVEHNQRTQASRRTITSSQIDESVMACNELVHDHPTTAALTAFDRSPIVALNKFYDDSEAFEAPRVLTEEEKRACHNDFCAAMSPTIAIPYCAACGVYELGVMQQVELLDSRLQQVYRLTDVDVAEYTALPELQQRARHVVRIGDGYYHLIDVNLLQSPPSNASELRRSGEPPSPLWPAMTRVPLCLTCMTCLEDGQPRASAYSVAGGCDFRRSTPPRPAAALAV